MNRGIGFSLTKRLVAAIAATILLIMLWASSGPTEEEIQLRHYCEMVRINRSNAELGWPDYQQSYDEECVNVPAKW